MLGNWKERSDQYRHVDNINNPSDIHVWKKHDAVHTYAIVALETVINHVHAEDLDNKKFHRGLCDCHLREVIVC